MDRCSLMVGRRSLCRYRNGRFLCSRFKDSKEFLCVVDASLRQALESLSVVLFLTIKIALNLFCDEESR